MGLSNYAQGLSSFGIPILGSGTLPVTTGKYFFVHSGTGANGASYKNSPTKPFATIDYAIGKCTDSKGDVIVVMPGHAETVVATTAPLLPDVIGITIVGLGSGHMRPIITMSDADYSIDITAANVTFKNLVFTSGVAELVTVFTITGKDATIENCEYYESNATYTFLSFVTTVATGDRLTVKNCKINGTTASAAAHGTITLVGSDDSYIVGNNIDVLPYNNSASFGIGGLTTASLRLTVVGNTVKAIGTNVIPISIYAATTGILCDNRVASTKSTAAGTIAPANMHCMENYMTHAVGTSAILDPVVDAS